MRFSLDVPVEKRSLKVARDAIRLDLEFPPPMESTERAISSALRFLVPLKTMCSMKW